MNCVTRVLRVDKLTVGFGANAPSVINFNLEVNAGQIVCLVGPSGAGKSTILRSIAQLQRYSGSVYVKDVDLSVCRPAQRSQLVGLAFQQGNLFANLTVLQNCAQPLMLLRGLARIQAEAATLQALAHVGMDEYAARYPRELSGGQAQRVALVRALVLEPAVMLFDEPTSALDAENKDIVCRLIRDYAGRGKACVVTTHDRGVIESLDARVVTL